MAGPIVIHEGNAHFSFGTAPVTIVDVSCDAYALEIGSDTETIDLGTFCNPSATDLGRTTQTAVLSLLWSPELYTKLLPHVNETGSFAFAPDPSDLTHVVLIHTRYAAVPWGRFEIGQRVEVDLALAVLDTITYEVVP